MRPTGHCIPDSHGPPGRGPTVREGGQEGERCGFCWFKWEGQPLKDTESPRFQPCLTEERNLLWAATAAPPQQRHKDSQASEAGGNAPGPSFSWQVVPTPARPPQPLGQEATSPGSTRHGPQSGPRSPRVLLPDQAGSWVPQDAAAHTPPTTRPHPARLS